MLAMLDKKSKFQVSNSKEMQAMKAKEENVINQDLFLSLLEFAYSLEFGF